MKRILLISLLLSLFPNGAGAFLSQSDPETFYDLVGQAPWVLIVTVEATQPAKTKAPDLIHTLKVEQRIAGTAVPEKIRVFEERVFAEQKGLLTSGDRALVLLASLPSYTSFADLKKRGVEYRLFGGKKGILSLTEKDKTFLTDLVNKRLAIPKNLAQTESNTLKFELLWKMWGSGFSRLQEEGIETLAGEWPPGKTLSDQQKQIILSKSTRPTLSASSRFAIFKLLEKSHSKELLRMFSRNDNPDLKWPAVTSLERLGEAWPTAQLVKDFASVPKKYQMQLADLLMKRRDEAVKNFFHQTFRGPESLEFKRGLLVRLSQQGDDFAEEILIREIKNPDPQVAAHAMAALGSMNSIKSIVQIAPFLDSKDKRLRDAAIYSLTLNHSLAAQQALEKVFGSRSHGELRPKRHFNQVPGEEPGRGLSP